MMEIVTDKLKLKLTPEEAQQMIVDETLEIMLSAVLSLEASLRVVNDFSTAKEEVVQKVVEKVKKESRRGSDNLIDKLYYNLVLNNDSDLTQGG